MSIDFTLKLFFLLALLTLIFLFFFLGVESKKDKRLFVFINCTEKCVRVEQIERLKRQLEHYSSRFHLDYIMYVVVPSNMSCPNVKQFAYTTEKLQYISVNPSHHPATRAIIQSLLQGVDSNSVNIHIEDSLLDSVNTRFILRLANKCIRDGSPAMLQPDECHRAMAYHCDSFDHNKRCDFTKITPRNIKSFLLTP